MTEVHERTKAQLERARERMKHWADKRRGPLPVLTEGQLVMLNARHVKTKRPAKKLDAKILGPFRVAKVISPTAVRLTLPKAWRIHDAFHVLREAPPVETEYGVQEIEDSMVNPRGRVLYRVRWEGYPKEEDKTWEPWDNFVGDGAKAEVISLHQRHPDKPRDERVPRAAESGKHRVPEAENPRPRKQRRIR
ncbi:hypothetical protein GGTG_13370 [Gaeumannomyces tritici R3-111a-1]|uniref:Chromo domain-containing protein n=1 Tax=Gaeumannomyces tritici (strain R3-111a-1) TaxID=644352 RepID=J3PIP1_GAET3|nr:hypothetical protein GGTG_13370 [Gaeumannomyces tritici R3-111a-1]EJT69102.1 hypothetical protein GGTG_13370 [Gaeumannomyces tritici R3-111a-1]